jgi:hypothetical protein
MIPVKPHAAREHHAAAAPRDLRAHFSAHCPDITDVKVSRTRDGRSEKVSSIKGCTGRAGDWSVRMPLTLQDLEAIQGDVIPHPLTRPMRLSIS